MMDAVGFQPRLTDRSLRKVLRREVLRFSLTRGETGLLVFIWSIGLIPLVLAAGTLLYAGLWSGATLILAVLSARSSFSNHRVLAQVISRVVDRSLPQHHLSNQSISPILAKSRVVFGEIALKVLQVEQHQSGDAGLHRLVGEAHSLLALQQQSAVQAEEFERALAVVRGDSPIPGSSRSHTAKPNVPVSCSTKRIWPESGRKC